MTPTQAQIEAAANAYWEAVVGKNQFGNADDVWRKALTAAAEVGEKPIGACVASWDICKVRDAATIERCAQMAEWEGYATVGRQIAAAIRKLKDDA